MVLSRSGKCVAFLGSLLFLGFPLFGCFTEPVETEEVGSFAMDGTLVSNSCGDAALELMESFDFEAEIRANGSGYATWRTPGQSRTDGREVGDRFVFEIAEQRVISAEDPANGIPGCTLEQTEVIEVQVLGRSMDMEDGGIVDAGSDAGEDAGVSDAGTNSGELRAVGTSRVRIAPVAGSFCAPALLVNGGTFDDLPCDVEYALEGDAIASIFE